MKTLLNDIKQILGPDFSLKLESNYSEETLSYLSHQGTNPASIVKLYILYAALVQIDKEIISLKDEVSIPEKEVVPGCGIIQVLQQRQYTIHDLIMLMITISDNTATNILIDILTLEVIQNTIQSIGINETFVRRKLYHIKPGIFNESTTSDSNKILKALYYGIGISKSMSLYAQDVLSKQQLKNLGKELIECPNCHLLKSNNTCDCGVYFGDVDGDIVRILSKSGEITGHIHDACIMHIDDIVVFISIFTYNQTNNKITQGKLSDIGKMVYTHYKELSC